MPVGHAVTAKTQDPIGCSQENISGCVASVSCTVPFNMENTCSTVPAVRILATKVGFMSNFISADKISRCASPSDGVAIRKNTSEGTPSTAPYSTPVCNVTNARLAKRTLSDFA